MLIQDKRVLAPKAQDADHAPPKSARFAYMNVHPRTNLYDLDESAKGPVGTIAAVALSAFT